MMKTCSIFDKIYDFNKDCYSGRYKKTTKQNKFRNTYLWQEKRDEKKERDASMSDVFKESL